MLNRRLTAASTAALFCVLLAACEKPDYKGVTFKPAVPDPQAYRTSLVAAIARRPGGGRLSGRRRTWRPAGLLGEAWKPVEDLVFVLDGGEVLLPDGDGIARLDGITAGLHSLAPAEVSSRRPAGPGERRGHGPGKVSAFVTAEALFSFPVRAVKDRMTVVLVDETGPGHRVYVETGEHDFILERLFRRLAARAALVDKLALNLVGMLTGRLAENYWPLLFEKDAAAFGGGLDDYLQALSYRVRTGGWEDARPEMLLCTFDEDRAELVVKLSASGGGILFERFVLENEPAERAFFDRGLLGLDRRSVDRFVYSMADRDGRCWRIASVGTDPPVRKNLRASRRAGR